MLSSQFCSFLNFGTSRFCCTLGLGLLCKLIISYNKKDSGSHAFGTCFRKQDACRLLSLALRLSVRRFHGRLHLPFLFSAGGGHATVASSLFCVWLHALRVHKLRHGGHAWRTSSVSSAPSPCLIFAGPHASVMPHIGHVPHGAYQKLYQLRAYVFFKKLWHWHKFLGNRVWLCRLEKHGDVYLKQRRTIWMWMTWDPVAVVRFLYHHSMADYLCSSFLLFSAGQPSVMGPAPLPTENSGGTHGKSRPVIYKASRFFDIFKKSCCATAYGRFRIIDRKWFWESW